MLHRYRLALCNVADPPAPVVPGTMQAPTITPPPAPTAPLPDALQALVSDPEAFKKRLDEAGKSAKNRVFEDLGVKDANEAKAALQELKRLKDAQLTEQERTKKALDDLTPQAARAATLEATIKEFLAAEEQAIPEDKRGFLSLAPPADKPEDRLRWISNAKAQGLFNPTPVAPVAPAARPANPANTIAPPGPATAPPTGVPTPQQTYDQMMRDGKSMAAAGLAQQYPSIDRAAWRKQQQ